MTTDRDLYGASEIADYLSVSRQTVHTWIKEGMPTKGKRAGALVANTLELDVWCSDNRKGVANKGMVLMHYAILGSVALLMGSSLFMLGMLYGMDGFKEQGYRKGRASMLCEVMKKATVSKK